MSQAIITGGSQSLSAIVAEQLARDQERSAAAAESPASRQSHLHWLPSHAVEPHDRQAVEFIGPHGEVVAGMYAGSGHWWDADGREVKDTPAMWRPRTV